jgi:predicted nucleic acid-binding Zn ribbon protein
MAPHRLGEAHCAICGKAFAKRSPQHLYCSKRCTEQTEKRKASRKARRDSLRVPEDQRVGHAPRGPMASAETADKIMALLRRSADARVKFLELYGEAGAELLYSKATLERLKRVEGFRLKP